MRHLVLEWRKGKAAIGSEANYAKTKDFVHYTLTAKQKLRDFLVRAHTSSSGIPPALACSLAVLCLGCDTKPCVLQHLATRAGVGTRVCAWRHISTVCSPSGGCEQCWGFCTDFFAWWWLKYLTMSPGIFSVRVFLLSSVPFEGLCVWTAIHHFSGGLVHSSPSGTLPVEMLRQCQTLLPWVLHEELPWGKILSDMVSPFPSVSIPWSEITCFIRPYILAIWFANIFLVRQKQSVQKVWPAHLDS